MNKTGTTGIFLSFADASTFVKDAKASVPSAILEGVLRTELLHFHLKLLNRVREFVPIAIHRVQHHGVRDHRDSKKLPIRPIKFVFGQFFQASSKSPRKLEFRKKLLASIGNR